jgi:hypothetical protein
MLVLPQHNGDCHNQAEKTCCKPHHEHLAKPDNTPPPIGFNPQKCCSDNAQKLVLSEYEMQSAQAKKHCRALLCNHLIATGNIAIVAPQTLEQHRSFSPPRVEKINTLSTQNTPLRL